LMPVGPCQFHGGHGECIVTPFAPDEPTDFAARALSQIGGARP
jgi:hypothetical protein